METKISGVGIAITEVKGGLTKEGGTYANVLLRTDDGNIIRMQFWGETKESVEAALFSAGETKGKRVGFRGILRGTYDEKPSVACRLDDTRTSKN